MPTEKVTKILMFTLAYTSSKFDVSIHEVVYMSNHFHLLLTAHTKCLPDFMEQLNSLTARALNALRGTTGTNIEKGYNCVEPQDPEKLLEHAVYTLANPCASDLVTKARHWKGVTTARMRYGDELLLSKPKLGLWGSHAPVRTRKKRRLRDARTPSKRDRSRIPKTATLRLVRPPARPELSDDELRDVVLDKVTARENELEQARQKAGKKVLKMRNVRAQHWSAMPGTDKVFGVRPTVSSTDKDKRIAAIQGKKAFELAYAVARKLWIAGDRSVEFPAGTWLLWRRYEARCVGES
ncbi:transposase [Enhygromyxa salina]|uniref:Transposase IS200 like protein n=1 Tax=Enhygromyxa salina TaxID=215803 RepID=A0A2S9XFF7_9BACT|nr:transposase [Enhygromyxa salina]PRP91592.1 Transposase IS200 like protein [Enhygromyxa salina]